jgi:hypothetical protein
MNRRERRAMTRQAPASIRAYAAAYKCPDCLSETTQPVADAFGAWHIDVQHDATCPMYRRLLAKGLAT